MKKRLSISDEPPLGLARFKTRTQARGEVSLKGHHGAHVPVENMNAARATTADMGLSRKQVHEARQVRDAERVEPGLVRRTPDQALEPRTRAEM